jgi:ATP-dependent Zn protease
MHNLERTADEMATAYHEAGHAVIALYHDRSIHRVSILPRQDYLGKCEVRKGVRRTKEDIVEQEILISLAGLAAESRLTGTYNLSGASKDLRYVRLLASDLSCPPKVVPGMIGVYDV